MASTMQPALAPRPGMQQDPNRNQVQDHAEQVLTQQLLYETQGVPHPPRPQPGVPSHLQPAQRDHAANIDPAISGGAPSGGMIPAPAELGTDDHTQHQLAQQQQVAQQQQQGHVQQQQQQGQQQPAGERRTYGKRELSTSKRAAQNRAAQRAFRQRKESYIRKLEEQVKDYENLTEAFKSIQAENYQLREYIISLQSRLIDSQTEVPELPGNIDLSSHRQQDPATAAAAAAVANNQLGAQTAADDVNQLNRLAVAGLGMRASATGRPSNHEEAQYLVGAGNNGMAGSKRRADAMEGVEMDGKDSL